MTISEHWQQRVGFQRDWVWRGILLVGALSPLDAGISVIAIAMAVGVSGGIGLFFGVIPARRAAQLDPIVALRSA